MRLYSNKVCTVMLFQRAEARKTFDEILYQEIVAELQALQALYGLNFGRLSESDLLLVNQS